MFRTLDPILHSPVRLAIMSVLISLKSAEFNYLHQVVKTSKGNLSFQLSKLKTVDYIEIQKSSRGNYPLTTCRITESGISAFQEYVNAITDYLNP